MAPVGHAPAPFAGIVALALVLLALAGRAAVMAGAPTTAECVERWNTALNTGRVDVAEPVPDRSDVQVALRKPGTLTAPMHCEDGDFVADAIDATPAG